MYSEAMSNYKSIEENLTLNENTDPKATNMEEVINRQREQKSYAEKLQNKSIDPNNLDIAKINNPYDDFINKNKEEIKKQGFNPYNPDNKNLLENLKTNLSFKETFSEERKKQGAGGLFEFEGGMYTTNYGQ